MNTTPYVPVFELTRGETVESIHFGAVAVVNSAGELVASVGNPQGVAFLRSTSKPFQALPFIEAGGQSHFGYSTQEVALMCASHSGTDAHIQVAQSIQQKGGFGEEHLMCGAHPPFHKPTAKAMLQRGEEPATNRHNCSGKHSGMLAHATLKGAALENYLDYEHPVQASIISAFAEMAGVPVEKVALGVDGCSAPNFAVPFQNAALALARLADPADLPEPRAAACRTIAQAMMAFPNMVAGPDRFDTDLMNALPGKLVAKGGAEGYQGIALMPGALAEDSPALGIVVKISDGDRRKQAVAAVTMEVLRQLGLFSETHLTTLSAYGPKLNVHNWRKLIVGKSYSVFELTRPA